MLLEIRILVRTVALGTGTLAFGVALSACGQKGTLYLPIEPAAANRATLPQTLRPDSSGTIAPAPAVSSPKLQE